MATQIQKQIESQIKNIQKLLSTYQVVRNLGDAVKEEGVAIQSSVDNVSKILQLTLDNLDKISDAMLQQAPTHLQLFEQKVLPILRGDDANYLNGIQTIINYCGQISRDLLAILPFANILLLENDAFTNLSTLAKQAESVKQYVEAKLKEANAIEAKARKTASGISIESAQIEFEKGQKSMKWKSAAWGAASIIFTIVFLGLTWHWLQNPPKLEPINKDFANIEIAKLIYYFTLRDTFLTTIGAVAAFSIKMFRSSLHMLEVNAHRVRVTNSIAAFLEACSSPEERSMVFSKLVENVINFGQSGLLSSENDGISLPIQNSLRM